MTSIGDIDHMHATRSGHVHMGITDCDAFCAPGQWEPGHDGRMAGVCDIHNAQPIPHRYIRGITAHCYTARRHG